MPAQAWRVSRCSILYPWASPQQWRTWESRASHWDKPITAQSDWTPAGGSVLQLQGRALLGSSPVRALLEFPARGVVRFLRGYRGGCILQGLLTFGNHTHSPHHSSSPPLQNTHTHLFRNNEDSGYFTTRFLFRVFVFGWYSLLLDMQMITMTRGNANLMWFKILWFQF